MSNHPLSRLGGALGAGTIVLALLVAPMTVLAADHGATGADDAVPVLADDDDAQPTDSEPTDVPPTDDGVDGEVVYDPFFISPVPDQTPAASPAVAVRSATGHPALTPPATDTVGGESGTHPGDGVPLLLAALGGLSITVFALGRVPAARRR